MPKKTRVEIKITKTDHTYAVARVSSMQDPHSLTIEEVIQRIATLNEGMRRFWSNAHGWAPIEAAQLLSKSRLDWQVSLSHTLALWCNPSPDHESSGRLILAWANLGSLVEGSLKLFLSVWYTTYKDDVDAIKKKDKVQDPDGLQLERLRQFFLKRIWDESFNEIALHIQQRRNAIHAFRDRDLGTIDEFFDYVRSYLNLLRYINTRLPYPDDFYIPRETKNSVVESAGFLGIREWSDNSEDDTPPEGEQQSPE